MNPVERDVRIYRAANRQEPFTVWFDKLTDDRARQKIQARIARLRAGNPGHTRSVGDGVHELKIDFGPGYRVYFGYDGPMIVILLCGGDKSTQNADIRAAKAYWELYKQEKNDAHR